MEQNKEVEYRDTKPYRIAQIIRKLGDGGIESVVYNYYNAMDHELIQYDVIYHSDTVEQPSNELISKGMRFFSVPPYQKDLFGYIRSLRKLFRENRYMIVHSNMNTISVFSLYAAWREGVPNRIIHNHNVPGGKEVIRNIIKYILRPLGTVFATDYFACSNKAAKWMYGKKFNKGLVKVIPNAIDCSKYQAVTEEEVNKLRKELGIQDKKVLGHVGRYTYAKNHRFLLDIAYELIQKDKSVILLLVGDGELRDSINKKIRDLQMTENVLQVGWVNNPEVYYRLMDVFIFPSEYEGLGMSVIEAQFSGIPCVVSNAVPDEAKISELFCSMNLKTSKELWIKEISSYIGKENHLIEGYKKYDISYSAASLSDYYMNKLEA